MTPTPPTPTPTPTSGFGFQLFRGAFTRHAIVGICGTGGAGKTTLAKILEQYFGFRFVPSVVRKVFEERGLTEADQQKMSPEELYELQMQVMSAFKNQFQAVEGSLLGYDENDCEKIPGPVVMDRTAADHYAYTLYRCREDQHLDESRCRSLLYSAQAHLRSYRLIIHLPPQVLPIGKDDNFRSMLPAEHVIIESLIDQCLKGVSGHVPVLHVDRYSIHERMIQVLAFLCQKGLLGVHHNQFVQVQDLV